ncbi:MAG TPA: PDZ domain-containing protein [Polyangiaceae bacterium]|nr:PDZ domain-containing protein [Polyangiaceae bacterium]
MKSALRFRRLPELALLGAALGCSAVYPELSTPVRPVASAAELEPPAPDDLVYIDVERAHIPPTTRDGRRWDAVGGSAPDPFVKLFMNDQEILETPVQSNTVNPTWPNQIRANYRVPFGSAFRIELWDSNPLNPDPICIEKLPNLREETGLGKLEVRCPSGARIVLRVEPARPKLGLGFYYELRGDSIFVTRLLEHSPAARAGLRRGDRVMQIQGRSVKELREGEAQSLINTHSRTGLELLVKPSRGDARSVRLSEGPIYVAGEPPPDGSR